MDIDKYLRNNLCDADYAEASAQLEADWQAAYEAGHRAGASAMREREDELERAKDGAYSERNQCVALIAGMALRAGHKAGRARTAIEGWSEDWHGCVYIDLPTGQVSWHFHDSHGWMFDFLPLYEGKWDGHDTPTKYARVMEYAIRALPIDPTPTDPAP